MNLAIIFLRGYLKFKNLLNQLIVMMYDSRIHSISFSKCKVPLRTFKSIYNGDITLEDVEKEQIELRKDLGRIKQEDPKNKSPEQKKAINNIKNLYDSRKKLFKCLMIIQRVCLKIFISQNKEQGLKY